jgi:cellulose synthase/poly-beta-1,6-N-acetylglucosamine synthase-like glycosyltransferase
MRLLLVSWLVLSTLVVYERVGYRLLLTFVARFRKSRHDAKPRGWRPQVTAIIAARNEEEGLGRCLDSIFSATWSGPPLEVIVVSDDSADATAKIAREYPGGKVSVVETEKRVGKTSCQNIAAGRARGDVLLFTDADATHERNSVALLIDALSDPGVGCVSARVVFQDPSNSGGVPAVLTYWSGESRLRYLEGELTTCVGASGAMYAVRREAYRPIPDDEVSDFAVSLDLWERGLRTLQIPEAAVYVCVTPGIWRELTMRYRVTLRSLRTLMNRKRLLNPFKFRLFSLQLLSHKLLRYALPPLLLVLAVVTTLMALLAGSPSFRCDILLGWPSLCAGLLVTFLLVSSRARRRLTSALYLGVAGVAISAAWVGFLLGQKAITWEPCR